MRWVPPTSKPEQFFQSERTSVAVSGPLMWRLTLTDSSSLRDSHRQYMSVGISRSGIPVE